MNKEKQRSEECNKEMNLTIQRLKSDINELKKQISIQTDENNNLKENLVASKQPRLNCDQEALYLDKIDKQSVKIDELIKENFEKDHKYSQLVERLQQTQEQFKQYQESQVEELNDYISKSEHKSIVQKLHQENQIVVKEVRKLLQTIEKYKQDEEKLKQIMDSSESALNHDQLIMIKEYSEISTRLMQYDDGKVQQNKRTIIDLLNQILGDYDSLLSRYKIVEAQLIDVKVKYAEAEEVKERLLIDMENSGEGNVSRLSRGSRGDRSANYVETEQYNTQQFKRNLKPASSTGFLSKASSIFGVASTFYNEKFGNNP